jgi:hypothetical protein
MGAGDGGEHVAGGGGETGGRAGGSTATSASGGSDGSSDEDKEMAARLASVAVSAQDVYGAASQVRGGRQGALAYDGSLPRRARRNNNTCALGTPRSCAGLRGCGPQSRGRQRQAQGARPARGIGRRRGGRGRRRGRQQRRR